MIDVLITVHAGGMFLLMMILILGFLAIGTVLGYHIGNKEK